jgi:hypothetical protein
MVVALLAATLTGTAVAGGAVATRAAGSGDVIRVPQDEPTIQDAVDASAPGALILVAPGVYEEAVTIAPRHENIVIRGVDRATTILDGELNAEKGEENGFLVFADGVAIENLTARNFTKNGFFWTGVDGYRGSYLTAIRNGDYGIYAFDSVHGQFDHSYASGSPDAGFYIGQCFPCDALIVDSEAEWNGLGYSGTNSGGNLLIARSTWHDNRAGIVPNSGSYEEESPERKTTIIGNHVYDNNNPNTSAIEIAEVVIGNGILLAGGVDNRVERNLVTGHSNIGIGAIPLPETALNPDDPDAEDWDARKNVVRDNATSANQYDLMSVTNITDASDGGGNCFSGNEFVTSAPADIEQVLPCGRDASGYAADIALLSTLFLSEKPPGADYTVVTLPDLPELANMPKAKTAKARPATSEPSIRVKAKALTTPTDS